MYLKSLTLKGFKSFASATTLKFEPGICAVVGPNGSGKSNVVDALAWVMGEQGAKTLRGGKMEDVIFAGAGERKPLGRAEVTLTIDNSDGALDIAYREVSVTRRMFRDGASEYEINGAKARLMDIQELLSDSGIGREMHVIVGQGRLAQILESKPEDRRAFIEEAAGVLKHRRRKEKAQRKLVSMQANLDRLLDLTGELGKQLKPLARQAEAARKAATVQAELRDATLKIAGFQLVELEKNFTSAEQHARVFADRVGELETQLTQLTQQQTQLEEELARVVPMADAAQQVWFDISSLAERITATGRIAVDRVGSYHEAAYSGPDPKELERRAQRAQNDHEQLSHEVDIARNRLEVIQEEVEQYQQAAQEADQRHWEQVRAIADRREGMVRLVAAEESQRARLEAARADHQRYQELVDEQRERLTSVERELVVHEDALRTVQLSTEPLRTSQSQAATEASAAEQRLEQVHQHQREYEREVSRLESRIDTLRATIPAVTATVADIIEVRPLAQMIEHDGTMGKALAVALGSVADAVVAMIDDAGLVLERLGDHVFERTTVLVADDREHTRDWHLDAHLPAGARWLLDSITIAAPYRSAVSRLLADVVVVATVELAREVVADDPRLRAVTTSGIICGQGWVQLGDGAVNVVEVTAEIDRAQRDLVAARAQLEELAGVAEGARLSADESRIRAAGATSAVREQESKAAEVSRTIERLEKQRSEHQREYERAQQRAVAAEKRYGEAKQQWEETTERLSLVDDTDTGDTLEEPTSHERDEAALALSQVKAMEMEAQLQLRTLEERMTQSEAKRDGLLRQAEQERRAVLLHQRETQRRRRQVEVAHVVADAAKDLARRASTILEQATRERDDCVRRRTTVQAQLGTAKDKVQAARQQLQHVAAQAHDADITRSQSLVRLEEAHAKITEQLGMSVADLLRDYTPDDEFDITAETRRRTQAERDLSSLGKVNPLALEEYKALEERYEFLSTQLADVEQARSDLNDVIDDVDRKILQLFTDAWQDVEAEFPHVFSTLFPGGEGRLVLTDPDDMLTTGIEVEARPPGKKVKRLSLLSGGEKSLTALALLVAIFRARPSPFYVMDEVEAALDDVNLRRLIALFEQLRKDSQLIVITHQKPTMDVANVLYGVTMRGDGVTRVISQRMSPSLQS